jgi:hypothetical protein
MGYRSSRSIGSDEISIRYYIRRACIRKSMAQDVVPACIPQLRSDGRWDCMVMTASGKLRLCATVGPFETSEECKAAFCH